MHASVNNEDLAGMLYTRYCEEVGGRAYDGKPLPDWRTFRADTAKRRQSDAWVAVANLAARELTGER